MFYEHGVLLHLPCHLAGSVCLCLSLINYLLQEIWLRNSSRAFECMGEKEGIFEKEKSDGVMMVSRVPSQMAAFDLLSGGVRLGQVSFYC